MILFDKRTKERGRICVETLVIILVIILCILGTLAYFLPTIIAIKKKHANSVIIALLNIIIGWTFLGWIGCLVFACIDADGSRASNLTRNIGGNKYEDLIRLQKLKESGAITEVEFEIEKQKLLR